MPQISLTAAILTVGALAATSAGAEGASKVRVEKALFGKLDDGTVVDLYTLTNTRGSKARIMTYGATLTEVHVPDRSGRLGDVVLGFDNLASYLKGHPYFGSTV